MKIGSFPFSFMLYFFFLVYYCCLSSTWMQFHSIRKLFFLQFRLLSPRSKKEELESTAKRHICFISFAFWFPNARLVIQVSCSGSDTVLCCTCTCIYLINLLTANLTISISVCFKNWETIEKWKMSSGADTKYFPC